MCVESDQDDIGGQNNESAGVKVQANTFSRLHSILIVCFMLLLCLGTGWLYRDGIPVNTNPMALLSDELPFQQVDRDIESYFPSQKRELVLVVDGTSPEAVDYAVRELTKRISTMAAFASVTEAMGGDFFDRNGLLYRDLESIETLTERLTASQPFLGALQNDLSINSLSNVLALAIPNMTDAQLSEMTPLIENLTLTMESVGAGETVKPISWQAMFSGGDVSRLNTRILSVKPRLDYGKVLSAGQSIRALRQLIADMRQEGTLVSWEQHHDWLPRVGITGDSALSHEEMKTVVKGLKWGGPMSLILVFIVMILGYRSIRYVAVTLTSLMVGLVLTAGVASLMVGRLNMISIAFAMLYVGLGVDFALHFLLHLRENLARDAERSINNVIPSTIRQMFVPLLLCAITTALGFFAFAPTAYVGVSELGVIAGSGMLISFVVTLTLAPSFLLLIGAGKRNSAVGLRHVSYVDRIQRKRMSVYVLAIVIAASSAAFAWRVDFNADPIALRDPKTESVRVTRFLLDSGNRYRHQVNLIADGKAEMDELVLQLKAVGSVDKVISLGSLIPKRQEEKIEKLEDLSLLMGLDFIDVSSLTEVEREADGRSVVQSDTESDRESLRNLADVLKRKLESKPGIVQLEELLSAVNKAAVFQESSMTRLASGWLSYFPAAYGRLFSALSPELITMASLPEDVKDQWLSQLPKGDGPAIDRYLVGVVPKQDLSDNRRLAEFVTSVTDVVPEITGGPVRRYFARRAIIDSFQQAFIYAVIGISFILLIELRSVWKAFLVLIPMLLGGLITLACMVLAGLAFNFANVIALPLLLGIGVDSGIHMVHHHTRKSQIDNSEIDAGSVSVKAIFLSCITTLCSFGNLGFSPHPGTASMGQVLTIGTLAMLLCTLGLLPALLARKSH